MNTRASTRRPCFASFSRIARMPGVHSAGWRSLKLCFSVEGPFQGHPDLPQADEAGQLVQGERHVERLVDEPEAREDRASLILDLWQARDVVRAGEANPVGIR